MSFCVDVVISIDGGLMPRSQVEEAIKEKAPDVGFPLEYLSESLSPMLHGPKGSFYVIAGTFNYWSFDDIEDFAAGLCGRLNKTVMLMAVNDAKEVTFKIFREEV